MFCKNCGVEIAEGKKFCPNCGSQITPSTPSQSEKKTKKLIVPIIIVILIAIIGIVIFSVLNKTDKSVNLAEIDSNVNVPSETNKIIPPKVDDPVAEKKKKIRNAKTVDVNNKNTFVDEYETVVFGKYEQNNNGADGFEDIEWIVLEKNQDNALLISKYILDCVPYSTSKTNETWETSYLRNWLNSEFYQSAFSSYEKDAILVAPVVNSDNLVAYTKGGNQTSDNVFVMSIDECDKFFGGYNYQGQLISIATRGTEYAKARGLYVDTEQGQWFFGNSTYWLRSPGATQNRASTVTYSGNYRQNGSSVDVMLNGVRPMIWVKYN